MVVAKFCRWQVQDLRRQSKLKVSSGQQDRTQDRKAQTQKGTTTKTAPTGKTKFARQLVLGSGDPQELHHGF